MGVGGHFAAQAVRVGNDGLHFLQRVLRGARVVALGEHAAGGADLDDVSAVFDDLADFVLHAFNAVGSAIAFGVILVRQQVVVAMAAGDAERRPAGVNTRAGQHTFVDGITQGNVCIPVGAYIA